MRWLSHREPTLALHVHVGIPDPEDAIRVLNRLRGSVPLLIALAANSPFSQGRDSGFASVRTVIFQGFPRTGTARRFSCYADYVAAVDSLIASGAIPDPSFLWWDVRLQPALGTVEVRVMDAQITIADSAALVALVQALARLALEDQSSDDRVGPEVLAENRFLAARDGPDSWLIDPVERELVPARLLVKTLLARCRAHDAAGRSELDLIGRLLLCTGAQRQRGLAREHGLDAVIPILTRSYAASSGTEARAA
jgi:glutamate---cysteine ligase / carboxylate-amine ligase